MHAFVVRHTWRPVPFEEANLDRFRCASPVEPVNEYTYTSKDSRTWAVFHEIPTRLFPAGASCHAGGHGITFFDGYIWPVRNEANLLPEMASFIRARLNANTVETFQGEMNGEYALVHVDETQDSIIAMCDPTGVTPLYFSEDSKGFVVSNRIHAIQAVIGGETLEHDLDTLAYLATWGLIPPGKTIFKGVEEFGPGCVIQARAGRLSVRRNPRPYHDLPGCDTHPITQKDWDDAIEEMDANLRFLNHCPEIYPQLGLSGGKDSRLVLSAAFHAGVAEKILYLTQGLDSHPDVIVAKEITERFSLPHRVVHPSNTGAVDSIRIFDVAMPEHMWFSEGMLNLFDPHASKPCGADPMLTGLNGETLKSPYDLHGHNTRRVFDGASAKDFFDRSAPLNIARVVKDEFVRAHRAQRHQWVDSQLALGTPAADLPCLQYTTFQSLRRNSNARKINGYWHHTINVLTGNRLYWLTYHIGAGARRREQVHFELMKRTNPWLTEHHFADQSWDRRLFPNYRPPKPVTASIVEQQLFQRVDWRTHIDSEPGFRGRVMDFMMGVSSTSDFWRIIDRDCLEGWFKQKEHGHMDRFHFFGALTIAMAMEKHQSEVKMHPVKTGSHVLVKQTQDDGIYAACQGKIRRTSNLKEFLEQGGAEEDIYTFPTDVMERFTLDDPQATVGRAADTDAVITPIFGFHNPEGAHVWIEKEAAFLFETDLKGFSFSLVPPGAAFSFDGNIEVKVRNDATGEIIQHTFENAASRSFTFISPAQDTVVSIATSCDYCPAEHGGADTRRLALMLFAQNAIR